MTDTAPDLRLYNTATRATERFVPLDPANVRMYVCGPTVYDRAHLGNARPAIVFDVLYRLLRHVCGPQHVTYVRNLTDVDDKINARVAETGRSIGEITEETIGWYHEDMEALGVLRPTHEPRATAYVAEMRAMIEDLARRGFAYACDGHVLFRVRRFEAYGALSGRSPDDMIAGARVEVAPYKEDPLDFVLWKPSADDLPGWDGPVIAGASVGRGRPGWHIECSAMADALLMKDLPEDRKAFDIHGGGNDLTFPHHENEIAQSRCAHPEGGFARYWVHNEMLQVEGRKMSKSLGNFFTVRDLLDRGVPGEVIRLVFLSTHYRKPMDWTEKKAAEAEKVLRRWRALTDGVTPGAPAAEVVAALADDLNSAGAIAALHRLAGAGDAEQLAGSAALLGLLTPELGGWQRAEAGTAVAALIERLLSERAEARKSRDFARADALRDGFAAAGVVVKDTSAGAQWEIGPDFDPAKLEALQ